MPDPRQCVRQFAAALLAGGLISSLLPGLAVAQDGSGELASMKKGLPEMPMQAPPENSLEYVVSQKPAIESRLLSDMESLENWEPWVDQRARPRSYGTISLSKDKFHQGQASVLLTSPANGEFGKTSGRMTGVACAVYRVNNEDWSDWNRITLWVYPDSPGFRAISFNVILHNNEEDGGSPSYDQYHPYPYLNYQLLENHKWNKISWEIPQIKRDKVDAIVLRYRLQGHLPEMTDTVKYYFDDLRLEKVEQPEHFEGWNVAPGQIAHNHVGYATGFPKTALASDLSANSFSLMDAHTKQEALKKPVMIKETPQGTFQVLDFSEFDRPGTYVLRAGDVQTRPFRIDSFNDLYRENLIKVLNFFYCQRCGTEIPGIHSVCHRDMVCVHDDKRIVINGGWHDAGDLSQSVEHTSEAVYDFLLLAEKLQDTDPKLAERLLKEARWGLDWVLKTRFGDGYRIDWVIMGWWSDGIFGTADDRVARPNHNPWRPGEDAYINFQAARAEAKAAMVLREKDRILADHALRCAEEDWIFATQFIRDMDIKTVGIGLSASLTLYAATKDDKYKSAAISYGDYILRCQQQENLSNDVPVKGFFFEDAKRENMPVSRGLSSNENFTATGLVGLLETFPDHENVEKWESAIRLYAEFYKDMSVYTAPYFMLPAGICDLNEAQNETERAIVKNGVRLSDHYFLRSFPASAERNSNSSGMLSKAIGLAAIAEYLDDRELLNLSYRQIGWFLGLNPFNQSLMWGEGYRYQGMFSHLTGDLVGGIPCGVYTRNNRDVPCWPSDNWHNPKEIWSHSTSDYLWLMAKFFN